jgi:hypothetical protein
VEVLTFLAIDQAGVSAHGTRGTRPTAFCILRLNKATSQQLHINCINRVSAMIEGLVKSALLSIIMAATMHVTDDKISLYCNTWI